jgi:hypothetical protein
LRLDNFSVSSDFSGLRAEVTLENETPEFRKVTSWAENETFRLCLETTFMNSDSILSQFLEKETPEFRKVQVRVEVKFSNFLGDNFNEF